MKSHTRTASRGELRPRSIINLALLLAAAFSLASCATVSRHYMDNVETKYPTVRRFAESTPPAAGVKMKEIRDSEIPGPAGTIEVRFYVPQTQKENSPVLFYIHGGGFVSGSINAADSLVRRLSRDLQAPAISIHYRLAPEHPWPAAIEDCRAAYAWAEENAATVFPGSNGKLIIAGESAGANLAAGITHWKKEEGGEQPVAQLLYAPYVGNPEPELGELWPSRLEHSKTSVITPRSIDFFTRAYTAGREELLAEPSIYPVLYPSFDGLAPAFVTICGRDTLRDESEAYAKLLERDGVFVVKMFIADRDHAWSGDPVVRASADFIHGLPQE
ncbi:MAG TPA: alpha/beta hydrolase [Treponemataceae bacterium]|nr:alpha/beta hydrolase [Treponemataceae bacterium]